MNMNAPIASVDLAGVQGVFALDRERIASGQSVRKAQLREEGHPQASRAESGAEIVHRINVSRAPRTTAGRR